MKLARLDLMPLDPHHTYHSKVKLRRFLEANTRGVHAKFCLANMDNNPGGEEGRVPRGLSLEQAQNIRRDRQLEDLTTRMDELMRMMQQGMHGRRNHSDMIIKLRSLIIN